MQTIGSVIIDVKSDTSKLVSGMEKAERKVEQTTKAMKNAIIGVATAYLSFEGVSAFSGMIKDTIDTADSLSKVAEKLGTTTEELSRLQYAAGFADVSISQLDSAMSAMIRRTGNFKKDGTGAAAKSMDELGISVSFAKKNFTDTNTTFNILIDRLSKVEDKTLRTKLAQDLFSKSAASVVLLAKEGTEELTRLGDQGERLGAIITNEMAQGAGEFNDNLQNVQMTLDGIKVSLASDLLPGMVELSKHLDKFENTEVLQNSAKQFTSALITASSAGIRFINGMGIQYETIKTLILNAIASGSILIDELSLKFLKFTRDIRASIVDTVGMDKAKLLGIDLDFNKQQLEISKLESNIHKSTEAMIGFSNVSKENRKDALEFNQLILDTEKMLKDSLLTQKKINEEKNKDSKSSSTVSIDSTDTFEIKDNVLKEYYIRIKNYEKAWLIESKQLTAKFGKEKFAELSGTFKDEFFDKIQKDIEPIDIEINFKGWDEFSNGLAGSLNGLQDLSKSTKQFNAGQIDSQQHNINMIGGVADMTQAFGNFYDEDDSRRKKQMELAKVMNAVQMAMQIAQLAQNTTFTGLFVAQEAVKSTAAGTTAILTQGQGDPYTAFARMAMMAALVASFGVMVSGGGGGGGSSAPDYTATIEAANFGSSTVERSGVSIENYSGNISKFIEGLDKATERLDAFGSEGTSLSGRISSITKGMEYYENLQVQGQVLLNEITNSSSVISRSLNVAGQVFTATGSKEGMIHSGLNLGRGSAQYRIDKLSSELSSILTEELSDSLTFENYNKSQLESIIGSFDLTEYNSVLEQINTIAITAKQQGGVLTQEDQDKLIQLYKLPNFIKGIDYEPAIEALKELNETIFDMTQTANNYELSFSDLKNTTNLRKNQILEEKAFLIEQLPELAKLTKDNFVEIYESLNPSNSDLIESYEEFGDLLLEQVEIFDDLTKAIESMGDSIEKTIDSLLGNIDGTDTQEQQIKNFWSNMNQADSLLALEGELSSEQQSQLNDLVSNMNALALSIQDTDTNDILTTSLVSELTLLKNKIDLESIPSLNSIAAPSIKMDTGTLEKQVDNLLTITTQQAKEIKKLNRILTSNERNI